MSKISAKHIWTPYRIVGGWHCPGCGAVMQADGIIIAGPLPLCEQPHPTTPIISTQPPPSSPITSTRRIEIDGVIVEGPLS